MNRPARRLAAALLLIAASTAYSQFPSGPKYQPPDTVKIERDIPYAGTNNPRQMLDLVLPKKLRNDRPLPVVVAIHGGAWEGGNKTSEYRFLSNLASDGQFAGVTAGYRLSGEARWPAQIHDCKAAIRWVRANAYRYHLDPDRIGIYGCSAGGHLVAMLGTGGDNEAIEGDLGPYKGLSTRVQCVVDEYGPSDFMTIGDYPSRIDHNVATSAESRLVGRAIKSDVALAKAASPISYVTRDDPPFLIIHGDDDPIVPINQSERLSKALKGVGVECSFIKVEGGGHGGFRNDELSRLTRQFFNKHLCDQFVGAISETPVPNVGSRAKR